MAIKDHNTRKEYTNDKLGKYLQQIWQMANYRVIRSFYKSIRKEKKEQEMNKWLEEEKEI